MKKNVKLLLIAAVYLGVCYGIGQYRNTLKESATGIEQTENNVADIDNDAETATESSEIATVDIWSNLSFEGVQETSDTPWNFNAGVFDMDGEGDRILLTPNTSATIGDVRGMKKISFEYEIHPWVRDASDGAGLLIWLLDEKDNIIYEDTIAVDSTSEWKSYEVNLDQYQEVKTVKILCNNGENGDDSGDWVVIYNSEKGKENNLGYIKKEDGNAI